LIEKDVIVYCAKGITYWKAIKMGGGIPEVLPWDFFHLGLLLVLIMVLITGIVIFVAVIGVCCFHWLDTKEQLERSNSRRSRTSTSSKSPQHIRYYLIHSL
jgi:hypothetical protein